MKLKTNEIHCIPCTLPFFWSPFVLLFLLVFVLTLLYSNDDAYRLGYNHSGTYLQSPDTSQSLHASKRWRKSSRPEPLSLYPYLRACQNDPAAVYLTMWYHTSNPSHSPTGSDVCQLTPTHLWRMKTNNDRSSLPNLWMPDTAYNISVKSVSRFCLEVRQRKSYISWTMVLR